MQKAIRIMDRQHAGKLLRFFFNGFGYQLRLAEAERKMQELTLPELKPTKRIKANPEKGLPARLRIDPRRRDAQRSNRRLKRGFDALDQNLLPLLGPFPVTPQQDITHVDLTGTTSDEERNITAHPQNWRGREIPNPPEDTAKNLVNIANFLMPPPMLGNQPGDANRFDKKGNLLIIKEEPQTSSSEDEVEIIVDTPRETRKPNPVNRETVGNPDGGDRNLVPEINEDEEPIPSISSGTTHVPGMTDLSNLSNLGVIPGHLEIDGDAMANFFNDFFKEMDVSITPKTGKIAGKWIFDGQENRVPKTMDRADKSTANDQVPNMPSQDLTRIGGRPNTHDQCPEEPRVPASPDPVHNEPFQLPGNTTMVHILEDHIALSPNPEKPPSETDPLEELLTLEQEERESESESKEEGIVNVLTTSESDQDEITVVNPTEMEADPEIGEQKDENAPQENNNNQEEQKTTLELPANRRFVARTPSRQLLLHRVPITFPIPGNLMESNDSLRFINEALGSLVESNGHLINLPTGAVIDATPLHRIKNYQARSAVILTFVAAMTRDRVWKAARVIRPKSDWSGRTEFYFTEIAKRTRERHQTHTEDELQDVRNDAIDTQEGRRAAKLKKKCKDKSQAVILATKLKNKYSALNEEAKKRKKKGGYTYDGTNEKLRLMREGLMKEGSVKAVSTPTAEATDANTTAADDLSTLVKDISSVVPVSKIDTMQAGNPVGQSFLKSTRWEEAETEEECLREETKLVEEVERIRD